MSTLLVATNNPSKLLELKAILLEDSSLNEEKFSLLSARDLALQSPIEDAESFYGNAKLKALAAYRETGLPSLADDSGLVVPALGGRPGIHSARFAGPKANDAENTHALLQAMKDIPEEERLAYYHATIVLVFSQSQSLAASHEGLCFEQLDETTQALSISGNAPGRILFAPRGEGGFGYDPVMLAPDLETPLPLEAKTAPSFSTLSYAELSPGQKNQLSHRGKALRAMAPFLRRFLKPQD